jgi:hypothetical protein
LPPALLAKDLCGVRTSIFNVSRIRTINQHSNDSDQNSAPESFPDTEKWLHRNSDFDNPNNSEEDFAADDKPHIARDNGIEHPEIPELRDVSAAQNVPRLIRPILKSRRPVQNGFVTLNTPEIRRNIRIKKK